MLAGIKNTMENNNNIQINHMDHKESSAIFPQDHMLPLSQGNHFIGREEQFSNIRKSSIEQYYPNDHVEVNYFDDEIYDHPMSNNNNSNFQAQQYKQEIEQAEEEYTKRRFKESECSTNAQSASIAPSSSYISPPAGYPLENYDFPAIQGNYLEQYKLSQIEEFELENHNQNPICTCAFNHNHNTGWKSLDASFELAKDDLHAKNYDFHNQSQQNQKHIGIDIPDHMGILNSSPLLSGEIHNKNLEIFSGQTHPADQFGTVHNQHCYSNQDSSYQDSVNYSFDYYSYFKANEEDLLEKPTKIQKVKNPILPIISEEERMKRRAEYCDMMRIRNNQRTGGCSRMIFNGEVAVKPIEVEEEGEVDIKEADKNNQDQLLISTVNQPIDITPEMKDQQTLILEDNNTKKQEQPLAIPVNFHISEEDTLASIDDMKLCNKKNVVKNIMNAFKNFILEAELKNTPKVNQKLVTLYNSRKIADEDDDTLPEIIKKFKRYINSKNFNHYSMRLLIIHMNYGPVLRYFLQGPIFEWAKTCKANDLAAHFVMVDFLLLSFTDIKHLDQLKRHEKKKAHYQ